MALVFESLHLEIFIGVVTALSLLYVYLTWNFDYWKKRGVPFVKPIPIFGSTKEVIMGRMFGPSLFKKFYDEYDGHKYVGIFQFREPALVLRDPEIIKDALVKNFSSFHDHGVPVDEEHPLTVHIFNLPGSKWRALRAKISPTFTSGKLKMIYPLMEECCEQLRKVLKEPARLSEEIDVQELMAQLTTDIIGSCAFGLQANAVTDSKSKFREMGRRAFQPSFALNVRILTLVYLNPIAKLLKLSYAPAEVEDFFLKFILDTIKYREKNNTIRNDFIHFWMQLKNKGKTDGGEPNVENDIGMAKEKTDDVTMTDNIIAAQSFMFFVAGFETSSTLMSFTLYELALHPDIQKKLREEIDATYEANGGELNYDVLNNMRYLDKVTSEALRKYPPIPCIFRACTKPYTIPGTNITVGTDSRLLIPILAVHNDPEFYPDPEKFDPERYTEEAKASRHPFAYIPFGAGPRFCIGKRFGLLQAKLGLVSLLREYQFSPSARTEVPIQFDPTSIGTNSKGGIHLKITPRD